MILFVSGQYAGAQYIHPLIKKWSNKNKIEWNIIAAGASCKYWKETNVKHTCINKISHSIVSNYLEYLKPTLVITSTSINYDFEAVFIIEAKKKSIPTASFIDFWSNYLNRFKYGGDLVFPDNIFAIDHRSVIEMTTEGVPENLIKMIGQPYFEEVQNNIVERGDKLLLTSQPLKKYNDNKLGYDESDFWDICFQAIHKTNVKKVLCTHHPEELYRDFKKDKNIVIYKGRGIQDIVDSHTVIGISSTQMILGYLWGRKVASIQPKILKKDLFPLSRWGLVPRLETVSEVIEFLKKDDLFESIKSSKKFNEETDEFRLNGSIDRLELFCLKYRN